MKPKEIPSVAIERWPAKRLLACLDRSGGPDACWPWVRGRKPSGYGHIGVSKGGRRWDVIAHRLAYAVLVGPIPDGLDVLHACDNPPCCNPAHLHPGTRATNNAEAVERGRHKPTKGADHHKAKLTDAAVATIRRRLLAGEATTADLATEYGVSENSVRRAASGEMWGHVNAPVVVGCGSRGETNGQAKLTADAVAEMRARYEAGGIRLRDLAAEYGVSEAAVSMAVNGKTWRHLA